MTLAALKLFPPVISARDHTWAACVAQAHRRLRSARVYTSGPSPDLQRLALGYGITVGFFVSMDVGVDAHQDGPQRACDEGLGCTLIHCEGRFHRAGCANAQLKTGHRGACRTHGGFNGLSQSIRIPSMHILHHRADIIVGRTTEMRCFAARGLHQIGVTTGDGHGLDHQTHAKFGNDRCSGYTRGRRTCRREGIRERT